MKEEKEENEEPLLNEINPESPEEIIKKKDEEMRDAYERYNKLLNKMKKNVDSMGSNKLMNYQNLFNEFNKDVIKFNEEQKKLIELKDSLNSETNLPNNIRQNLSKVNKDFANKQKIFEEIKSKVEEYKDKYTKDESNKYDEMFNNIKNKENDEEINEQKLIIKNNDQIFEERKNMIIQAKKTSSQVVDTTKMIKNEIQQQGEHINDIENNIIEAVDNFKKGGEEIKKFKNTTEKQISKKKLAIFGGAILVLILIIYYLIKKLF
jgi:t-SNARE complex subunit (syntaxin)